MNHVNMAVVNFVVTSEVRSFYLKVCRNKESAKKDLKTNKVKMKKEIEAAKKQKGIIELKIKQGLGDNDEKLLDLKLQEILDERIQYFSQKLVLNPVAIQELSYAHFRKMSLFVTSLLIYGYLRKSENEKWLEDLLASKAGDYGLKLQNLIVDEIKRQINLESWGEKKSEQILNEILASKLIPIYPDDKKIATYRGKLKRILLKSKLIKFENNTTLNFIADLVVRPDLPFLEVLIKARYEAILLGEKESSFMFVLSQNDNFLLLMETSPKYSTGRILKKIGPFSKEPSEIENIRLEIEKMRQAFYDEELRAIEKGQNRSSYQTGFLPITPLI